MKYLFLYLLLINVLTFALFGIDKGRAKKKKWRIRERTLFLFSALGGSIGAMLGMKAFHHKTLHKQFVFGIPLIFVLQLALGLYLYLK